VKSDIALIQLTAMRDELKERVSRVESDIRRQSEPLDEDSSEAIVQKENDTVLDGLDVHIREEIAQVERAIERILRGNYGVCARCGDRIAGERLWAIPYATTCERCA